MASNLDIVKAGFKAILGVNISNEDENQQSQDTEVISLYDLFEQTHIKEPARTTYMSSSSRTILLDMGGPGGFFGGSLPRYKLDERELDPVFDYDFTNEKDDGEKYLRGGFEYRRPYGWNRVAIKVIGKYESDDWLGPDGIRTYQSQNEWPVSYHGTNFKN